MDRRFRRVAFVVAVAVLAISSLSGWAGGRGKPKRAVEHPHPVRHHHKHRVRAHRRPPQFLVVSFDGSGGTELWPYWRLVARRAHARFTFFVSGVYLLDEARRTLYRPPEHRPGHSDIGFAQAG